MIIDTLNDIGRTCWEWIKFLFPYFAVPLFWRSYWTGKLADGCNYLENTIKSFSNKARQYLNQLTTAFLFSSVIALYKLGLLPKHVQQKLAVVILITAAVEFLSKKLAERKLNVNTITLLPPSNEKLNK